MLRISIQSLQSDIHLMVLNGNIDENTIGALQDNFTRLFSENKNKIICDMKNVKHISAPVLKTFLENITTARNRGGDIKLVSLPPDLQGILRYAGFNDDSALCTDIQTAIQQLQQPSYPSDHVEDPFGATIQTSQSPLKPASDIYAPTIQNNQSPLQRSSSISPMDDPYGATIQMTGSPLQNIKPSQDKADDPYEATIQMTDSPLENRLKAKEEKTLQADKSPLSSSSSSTKPSESAPKKKSRRTKASAPKKKAPPAASQPTSTPSQPAPAASPPPPAPTSPPQVPQESAAKDQIQEVVETELKRKSTIRFYNRMYPFCIFPLKVIFSQQKIQKIVHKKIAQVEGKKDVVVSKEKPIVEVVPHFPGCLIVPSRKKVDVTPEISQANFSVTPLAESKNQKGYVEIYYNGEVIDTVEELKYHVEKQTIAKFALYMSIISPVISTSLDAFQIDFNEKLPMAIEWLSKLTQLFGGKTGFGLALAGVFLFISIVFYFLKRPREANPIENILPVD
ncbi:STAS domain-containing protein [Candidatus Uabimicrobium amorphum]|uniref:Anti-sigma factor antagonist n=1 Tax=Uabimicrobium amorphum TaxID=2596890 RepID=A0A5S9IR52_UABAM|nr:STAS domain-containing protein [Candidatus Uabimicrobium amorphum]BBM85931.1 anti-sigma factor antagonist [Candidatus Uabimicrobium amorphum]